MHKLPMFPSLDFFFLLTVLCWSTFFSLILSRSLLYLQGFVSFSAFSFTKLCLSLLLSTFICKSAPFPPIVKLLFIPFHYPVTVFYCFFSWQHFGNFFFEFALLCCFLFPRGILRQGQEELLRISASLPLDSTAFAQRKPPQEIENGRFLQACFFKNYLCAFLKVWSVPLRIVQHKISLLFYKILGLFSLMQVEDRFQVEW